LQGIMRKIGLLKIEAHQRPLRVQKGHTAL